jgi:hypothetical protein
MNDQAPDSHTHPFHLDTYDGLGMLAGNYLSSPSWGKSFTHHPCVAFVVTVGAVTNQPMPALAFNHPMTCLRGSLYEALDTTHLTAPVSGYDQQVLSVPQEEQLLVARDSRRNDESFIEMPR